MCDHTLTPVIITHYIMSALIIIMEVKYFTFHSHCIFILIRACGLLIWSKTTIQFPWQTSTQQTLELSLVTQQVTQRQTGRQVMNLRTHDKHNLDSRWSVCICIIRAEKLEYENLEAWSDCLLANLMNDSRSGPWLLTQEICRCQHSQHCFDSGFPTQF